MGCSGTKVERPPLKLVVLGIGGVGKSTIFKQIKLLHASGFTEQERLEGKSIIIKAVLHTLRQVIIYGMMQKTIAVTPELEELNEKLDSFEDNFNIKEEADVKRIKGVVVPLWQLADVKETLKILSSDMGTQKVNMADNDWAEHFLNQAETVISTSYLPTDDDLLKLRRETSGAQYLPFLYKGEKMVIVDVGGQIHERSSWDAQFDNVLSIIYVVSLADYDRFNHTKTGGNKLLEALQVYNDLLKDSRFEDKPIVILFNKCDLFMEMIKTVGIATLFPECEKELENDYEYSTAYIMEQFTAVPHEGGIYTHLTCATDTALVSSVFDRITQALLFKGLSASGLE